MPEWFLRRFGLSAVVACLVVMAGLAAAGAAESVDETVVARVFVPSAERRVGEVRLLRRGGEPVVQTLLYTKLLARVVREIAAKETANWLPGSAGHADAARYLEALRTAERAVPRPQPGGSGSDRTRRLLIEFRADAGGGTVRFARFETEGPRDDLRVRVGETLLHLDVSPAYIERNMVLIAADAFGVAPAEVERLWSGAVPAAR